MVFKCSDTTLVYTKHKLQFLHQSLSYIQYRLFYDVFVDECLVKTCFLYK